MKFAHASISYSLRIVLPKQLPLGREIRARCPLLKRREATKGFRLSLDNKVKINEDVPSLSMLFICFDPNNIKTNIMTWQDRLALSQLRSSIDILNAAKTFELEDMNHKKEFEARIVALEAKRDQLKAVRKEQDIAFRSKRKALEIECAEKEIQAFARVEKESERHSRKIKELSNEFNEAISADKKAYDSKIDRLRGKSQDVESSFDSSKHHLFEDIGSKIKADSEYFSNVMEEETNKGKQRRATMISSAKSQFQEVLENMVRDMNASQDARVESLHELYHNTIKNMKRALDSRWEDAISNKVRRSRSVANDLLTHMHYEGKKKVHRASTVMMSSMNEEEGEEEEEEEEEECDEDDDLINAYKEMIRNESREHERISRELNEEYSKRLDQQQNILEQTTRNAHDLESDISLSEMDRRFQLFQNRLLEAHKSRMKTLEEKFEKEASLALESHRESFVRSFKTTTAALSSQLRLQNASRQRTIMNMSKCEEEEVSCFESPSKRLIAFARTSTPQKIGTHR